MSYKKRVAKESSEEMSPYLRHQGLLNEYKGLILHGRRIWITTFEREEMLKKLHDLHLGQTKMQALASTSIWWPNLGAEIWKISESCIKCAEKRPNWREPLITSELPQRPRQKVGADLLKHHGNWYIVLIDYYSKYIEISHLPRLNSMTVIQRLEVIFARFGIPEIIFTDNGGQLTSKEMKQLEKVYDFKIITRSPAYLQANGLAEAAVKITKGILDAPSPCRALMLYRATPTSLGASPAQLLFNRQIRSTVPTIDLENQIHKWEDIKERHEVRRGQMERQFNKAHGVRPLSELKEGTEVLVEDPRQKGVVIQKRPEPRSYIVRLENGRPIRRNRKSLRCPQWETFVEELEEQTEAKREEGNESTQKTTEKTPPKPTSGKTPSKSPKQIIYTAGLIPVPYFTRAGREVFPPDRFEAEGPLRDRSSYSEFIRRLSLSIYSMFFYKFLSSSPSNITKFSHYTCNHVHIIEYFIGYVCRYTYSSFI